MRFFAYGTGFPDGGISQSADEQQSVPMVLCRCRVGFSLGRACQQHHPGVPGNHGLYRVWPDHAEYAQATARLASVTQADLAVVDLPREFGNGCNPAECCPTSLLEDNLPLPAHG